MIQKRKNKCVFFTKYFDHLPIEKMDLCTTCIFTDLTKVDDLNCEKIYEICEREDVKVIKVTNWIFQNDGGRYIEQLDRAKKSLEGFQTLSQKYKVKTVTQMHSGICLHSNCATSYLLLKDFDPKFVGIFLDPGHMALDGEAYGMGFDIVKDYIEHVMVKSVRWIPAEDTEKAGYKWQTEWCPLKKGIVPWKRVLWELKNIDYSGPLAFHTEYEKDNHAKQKEFLKEDLQLIRKYLKEID